MGVSHVADSALNQRLAQSVNAFHLFLSVWSRFGWMPFIGHNALLRTSAVRQIGGCTPGYFADDVDLTVRLNVAGYTVVYAPEIHMGETHPTSYAALRKRSYKWAYGCMQALKAHAWRVLSSPRLPNRRLAVVGSTSFDRYFVMRLAWLATHCQRPFSMSRAKRDALHLLAPHLPNSVRWRINGERL